MARQRYVNTDFWRDEYIEMLDPLEKYLFIYCLTNPLTTIAGIYKISLKRIAFETGIDKDMLSKMFDRFKKDDKIIYDAGYIGIKNFIKHQKLNPNIKKGIDIEIEKAPADIINWINNITLPKASKGFERLPKALNYDNDNDNVNDNDNTNDNGNIINMWNKSAILYKIPKIDSLSKTRISKYNLRKKEGMDLVMIFEKIGKSDFLQGSNDRNWKIDFDWLISNDTNWIKIMEDKYANKRIERKKRIEVL